MPSIVVRLYSVFFKALLKHKLLNSGYTNDKDGYVAVSRPNNGVPANSSFTDGVATKDIYIDPLTSLSLRIFLPESVLPQELITYPGNTGLFGFVNRDAKAAETVEPIPEETNPNPIFARSPERKANQEVRRRSYGGEPRRTDYGGVSRRSSYGGQLLNHGRVASRQDYVRLDADITTSEHGQHLAEDLFDADPPQSDLSKETGLHDPVDNGIEGAKRNESGHGNPEGVRRDSAHYRGYIPDFSAENHKKLPIIVQFHGGGFVTGSKDTAANDIFCRRMAKLCDAIVIAVGYRLAPEHKYPAAFDDGFEALSWLAKQANLAECSKSIGHIPAGFSRSGSDNYRPDLHRELVDSFGGSAIVEPWLAAHGDPARCVLLGVSSGGNIADFVARKAVQAGRLLEPVKVVAQVLMYPFFIGTIPTRSEIKLANSYFYDKASCILAWKLFFPDGEYNPDHPVANPLVTGRQPPLKHMLPTLTVVGELDWMKDRAIAYSEALRRVNLDAPVLEYKDAVHEFATLDFLVKSRQAESCAEDIMIWVKKYISLKGHELSY